MVINLSDKTSLLGLYIWQRYHFRRKAFESMRDSDFDSLSAYGEAVDNAIQANASTIRINFDVFDEVGRVKTSNQLCLQMTGAV